MRPVAWLSATAAILIFGSGCGRSGLPLKEGRDWKGMTEEQVIDVWGKPAGIAVTEHWGQEMKAMDYVDGDEHARILFVGGRVFSVRQLHP